MKIKQISNDLVQIVLDNGTLINFTMKFECTDYACLIVDVPYAGFINGERMFFGDVGNIGTSLVISTK